jgi:maltose O-acetyltransferase
MSRDVTMNRVLASPWLLPRARTLALRSVGMRLDRTVSVNPGCFFGGIDIEIGANSGVGYQCFFDNSAPITIGKLTGLGMQTMLLTSSHEIGPPQHRGGGKNAPLPIKIGDGCWIGARVTVLPGVQIGDGCVVAAGSLVTSYLAPHGIYGGSPAVRIRGLEHPLKPDSARDGARPVPHRMSVTNADNGSSAIQIRGLESPLKPDSARDGALTESVAQASTETPKEAFDEVFESDVVHRRGRRAQLRLGDRGDRRLGEDRAGGLGGE